MVAGGINSVFPFWINAANGNIRAGLNGAYLENIFFVAAGCSATAFVLFVFVSSGFKYVDST
jgi:hypothetical protein